MRDPVRTDCVVDARFRQVIIWHVNTGLAVAMPRLTGAWVIGIHEVDKVKLLVEQRRVLSTRAGKETLCRIGIDIPDHIDPEATLSNIAAQRDELQALYEALQRDDLIAPHWPTLPERIDIQNPPRANSPEPTQVALALARWLERVADAWDRIEAQRVVRKYMPGGRLRRATPIALLGC